MTVAHTFWSHLYPSTPRNRRILNALVYFTFCFCLSLFSRFFFQLFFACASGNTTVARYLTRIEVGARYDLKDKRGHLAGEYFWESVEPETRDEIVAILVACGWPHPPPPPRSNSRLRGRGSGRGSSGRHGGQRGRSTSAPPSRTASPRDERGAGAGGGRNGRAKRHSDGGEAAMKRLASDMMTLMKRR